MKKKTTKKQNQRQLLPKLTARSFMLGTLVIALVGSTAIGLIQAKGRPDRGTVEVVMMESTDGQLHHGQKVKFNVTTDATDLPFVGVRCYQGDNFVLDAYVGYFEGYLGSKDYVTLDSTYWDANLDAACSARLFYFDRRGTQKILATTDFVVLK